MLEPSPGNRSYELSTVRRFERHHAGAISSLVELEQEEWDEREAASLSLPRFDSPRIAVQEKGHDGG